jgi:hypothetical protein
MIPAYLLHADWGSSPNKRWSAEASLRTDGRYSIRGPKPIENHGSLLEAVRERVGDKECAFVGFDFPIGIPEAYAQAVGVANFKSFLKGLGAGEWADFYSVARDALEINLRRPFYPHRPGNAKQAHLLKSLGVDNIDALRRRCEKRQPGRPAACSLFWTLGANQVGKAAIVGWRDLLAPALQYEGFSIWPFDGKLDQLFTESRIVVCETYPAECYRWVFREPLKGKGKLEVRKKAGDQLMQWVNAAAIELEKNLVETIREGFPSGDDSFDAIIGLLGMIEIVMGRRPSGEPQDTGVKNIEGWILGQAFE